MSIFHKWMVHCSFHFHLNRSFVYVKCRRMEVLHRSLSLSVIPFSLWLQSLGETIQPAACFICIQLTQQHDTFFFFFCGHNLFSGCCFYEDISPNLVLVAPSQQCMFSQISTRHDAEPGFGGTSVGANGSARLLLDILRTCLRSPCSATWGLMHIKTMWCCCLCFSGITCCDPRNLPLKEYFNLCRWAHQSLPAEKRHLGLELCQYQHQNKCKSKSKLMCFPRGETKSYL